MTPKEAYESLCYEIYEEGHCSYIEEELDIAIKALKKQIAEKPDVYSDGYADGYEVWEEHCPNCYYDFDGDNPSYCPRCGQKINWGEEE